MDLDTKKFLLETTLKIIKESNGNGLTKSFSPKNIGR